MRKIFTSLKTIVAATLVAAMSLSVSCSYDDTGIKNEIENVKADLAALAERVAALENKLNSEVDALKALINEQVVVVDVVTDANGNQTIKLSDGSEITVLAPVGCDHVCDVLQYRVIDGVLEVSADGQNWIAVKVAPEQVVANIVLNEDGTATITLANGEEFTVVKAELIECEAARTGVYVVAGGSRDVAFAVNDAVVDINVMNQPFGWSATVEEAVAGEENGGDAGIMPLAAGGKNYVLKIYGPAPTLAEAATEGIVSVHFNTAAGACKVLKVNVQLAQITLSVDNSGNVTLTNSVAESRGVDELGNPMFDFADFHIGIVDAADYATYGDKVFVDTFDDWTYEYSANVATTMRTTGFQNVIDLQFYEDGVCEKEVYTFTVDQLASCFWPKYTFELGKEYIIFVTTDSEVVSYVEHPILTNAAKANYKRVNVEAKLLEETITWNDATCEFNFAGYNYYVVGWTPVSDLQDLINNGMATDLDSALSAMISAYGVMSAGAIVADMNATVKLSELATVSLTQWAPMLNSDTEYVFFVYPFNAATEMELYMHTFIPENLFNYGTFRTKALVQGSFDAAAEFELVTLDENNVTVNATFSEDVVTVAYNWSLTSYVDPEEGAAFILGDLYYTEYVTFDEYVTYLEASSYKYYGIPESYYLCVLAINAAGEYAYVEYNVRSEQGGDEPEPEPSEVTYDSADTAGDIYYSDYYVNLHGSDGSRVVMNFYGISEYNTYFIPAGTYDFGAWYGAVYTGGYSRVEYSDGTRDNINGGTVAVAEVDGKYRIEVNAQIGDANTAFTAVYEGLIDGLILPSEYVEPEPEPEPEPVANAVNPVRAEYDNKFDLYEYNGGDAEYAFWLYDENNNYVEVIHRFGSHTGWNDVYEAKLVKDGVESAATSVQTQAPNTWNCNAGELYFVVIATFENGEAVEIQAQLPAVEVNYLGEGSTYAPGSENQGGGEGGETPEPEVPGETTELTITSHAFGYTGSMETEVIFTDVDANQHIVDFRMTGIEAGTYNSDNNGIILGFCRYMYGRSDYGGGVVFDSANGTITDNGDTTFTFDVNFVAEGAAYHFTYTTPAQEVNSDVTTVQLVSKSAGETISWYKACTFSDAEGNNSVKLIVDEYYSWDSATDFPKANEYTTWQSSYAYITNGSHFSFVNNSLVVNGVTYANDAVSNAKLTVVAATSVTIEFTVDGNDYKFVYSI